MKFYTAVAQLFGQPRLEEALEFLSRSDFARETLSDRSFAPGQPDGVIDMTEPRAIRFDQRRLFGPDDARFEFPPFTRQETTLGIHVYRLGQAYMEGRHGLIFDHRRRLLDESLSPQLRRVMELRGTRNVDLAPEAVAGLSTAAISVYGAGCVIHHPWYKNFGHWHHCVLPRVELFRQLGLTKRAKLVFLSLEDWQRKSIDGLGLRPGDYLVLGDSLYKFDQLFVTNLVRAEKNAPECVRQVYRQIGRYFADGLEHDRRIFVSRKDSASRRMRNEDVLERALASLGFESVVFGAIPYEEQVRTASSAACIVGSHGAGMVNAGFAPADATVVELFPREMPYDYCYALTAAFGQSYAASFLSTDAAMKLGDTVIGGEWNVLDHWTIDVEKAVELIRCGLNDCSHRHPLTTL